MTQSRQSKTQPAAGFEGLAPPSLARVMLHWLAHWFGYTTGRVVSRWDRGTLLIGFRCDVCGGVSHQHPAMRVRGGFFSSIDDWTTPWQ